MITQYLSNLDMTTLDIELNSEALDSMFSQGGEEQQHRGNSHF
jgi:hypothetical protein